MAMVVPVAPTRTLLIPIPVTPTRLTARAGAVIGAQETGAGTAVGTKTDGGKAGRVKAIVARAVEIAEVITAGAAVSRVAEVPSTAEQVLPPAEISEPTSARLAHITDSHDAAPLRPAARANPPNLEHASGRLDLGPGAPPGHERVGKRGIHEVYRCRVIECPAHARWRHRPAIGAEFPSSQAVIWVCRRPSRQGHKPTDGKIPPGLGKWSAPCLRRKVRSEGAKNSAFSSAGETT
jgi:hypothetical protein